MSYFHRKFQITKVNRNSLHDLNGVTGLTWVLSTKMSPYKWKVCGLLRDDLIATSAKYLCSSIRVTLMVNVLLLILGKCPKCKKMMN